MSRDEGWDAKESLLERVADSTHEIRKESFEIASIIRST